MDKLILIILLLLFSGCHKKEQEVNYDRFHVVCVDSTGKEYYNKIGMDISRDGGNIAVFFGTAPYYSSRDVVTGNCVASQFDIRDKKE